MHVGLHIGNDVDIAAHTVIIPSNHVFTSINTPIRKQGNISKGIIIEDNVWIGAGCKILDGVTIEKGAILGAGSVITRSVESNTIVAGIPAKIISKRK